MKRFSLKYLQIFVTCTFNSTFFTKFIMFLLYGQLNSYISIKGSLQWNNLFGESVKCKEKENDQRIQ